MKKRKRRRKGVIPKKAKRVMAHQILQLLKKRIQVHIKVHLN